MSLQDLTSGREGSLTARALMKPKEDMSLGEIFYAHGPKSRRPHMQHNNSLQQMVQKIGQTLLEDQKPRKIVDVPHQVKDADTIRSLQ